MPTEHSSRQYDLDLEAIRSMVFTMGGLVEGQFEQAMECFRTGDEKRALAIIEGDVAVNQLEIAVDDACSHLIVKRQPAAVDLRLVMAHLKVITDLERVGDEAIKIARVASGLSQRGFPAFNHYETVRVISSEAAAMLRGALDAFARLDVEQARELLTRDKMVDHELRSILRNGITFMMEDPRTISATVDTLWVAKACERIGDHATNIAEYVIYVVEGKDIRHQGPSLTDTQSHARGKQA